MHTKTPRKILRLLFPLALLYLIYSLTFGGWNRGHASIPTSSETSSRTPQPVHAPISIAPFTNASRQPNLLQNILKEALLGIGQSASSTKITKIIAPPALLELTKCPLTLNKFTKHIRLPNLLYNISMVPEFLRAEDKQHYWNPTIIALPHWAKNQYIIVNMVATSGAPYRRNVLCEANICHPRSPKKPLIPREKACTEDDLRILGENGGLRCVTKPVEVNLPATPAEKCEGVEQLLADIPGFHDPRLFFSGRGEPILMVASQSQYACIGLWAIDLRIVYPSIQETFSTSPRRLGYGPLISYPQLTELTRNPPWTRRSYEKNWVVFSPSPTTSYVQYELNSTHRTFAQLVGDGLSTQNMTDPLEEPCLYDPTLEELSSGHFFAEASWHQATPSLKLVLCERSNSACRNQSPSTVFFAIIHRKHINGYGLPVRYERYFIVWSATEPFNMLAVSQHPILFANETSLGWDAEEIWDDIHGGLKPPDRREEWDYFTYTTTIAWAWGREESDIQEKNTGYLDDEVIVSVGINDNGGLYGKVKAVDFLQCLRICPGRE